MKLAKYLEQRDESENAFATRSGVPQRTVNRIAREESVPLLDTASLIVAASRKEPTPNGGTVTYDDLMP